MWLHHLLRKFYLLYGLPNLLREYWWLPPKRQDDKATTHVPAHNKR